MDTQEAKKLSVLYRMQLTELMEIWASHSIDSLHGGYLTDFGEDWKLVSDRKNIWAQARQTYMFAAYAAYLGHNPTWQRLVEILLSSMLMQETDAGITKYLQMEQRY